MNTNQIQEDYVEPMKSRMAQKVGEMQDRVTDTARNMSYATDRYVRENPWVTIGAVALAACLLGWFLRSAQE